MSINIIYHKTCQCNVPVPPTSDPTPTPTSTPPPPSATPTPTPTPTKPPSCCEWDGNGKLIFFEQGCGWSIRNVTWSKISNHVWIAFETLDCNESVNLSLTCNSSVILNGTDQACIAKWIYSVQSWPCLNGPYSVQAVTPQNINTLNFPIEVINEIVSSSYWPQICTCNIPYWFVISGQIKPDCDCCSPTPTPTPSPTPPPPTPTPSSSLPPPPPTPTPPEPTPPEPTSPEPSPPEPSPPEESPPEESPPEESPPEESPPEESPPEPQPPQPPDENGECPVGFYLTANGCCPDGWELVTIGEGGDGDGFCCPPGGNCEGPSSGPTGQALHNIGLFNFAQLERKDQ